MSLFGCPLLADERGLETRLQPSTGRASPARLPGCWQLPKRNHKRSLTASRGRVQACPGFPASPGLVEETMLDSLAENLRLDYHRQARTSGSKIFHLLKAFGQDAFQPHIVSRLLFPILSEMIGIRDNGVFWNMPRMSIWASLIFIVATYAR